MNKATILMVSVLTAMVLLMFVSTAKSAVAKGKKRAGEVGTALIQNEFHLTCTILVDGTPSDADDGGSEGDEESEEMRRRSAKGKPKKRAKRSAGKVQLLCDIDNPEGQEVARRTAKARKGKGKGKGKA